MKKTMATILLLIFSVNVFAAGSTVTGKISRIYVNAGWTMVHVPEMTNSGFASNPDSCNQSYYYAIHPDDDNYDALHSVLLSAQMTGKDVYFWVNGCGGQQGNFPKIVSVFVNT